MHEATSESTDHADAGSTAVCNWSVWNRAFAATHTGSVRMLASRRVVGLPHGNLREVIVPTAASPSCLLSHARPSVTHRFVSSSAFVFREVKVDGVSISIGDLAFCGNIAVEAFCIQIYTTCTGRMSGSCLVSCRIDVPIQVRMWLHSADRYLALVNRFAPVAGEWARTEELGLENARDLSHPCIHAIASANRIRILPTGVMSWTG